MSTYSYSGNKKHKKKQNHASEYLPYLINELADEIEVVEQVLSRGEEGQVLTANSNGKAQWAEGGGSGTPLVDITYAQLVTLIGASGLTAGQQYRITDFATTHYIVDGDNTQYTIGDGVIVGATEPLIIMATAVDKLDTVAKSATYPQDIIYYDWNPDNWLHDLSFAVGGTTIITGWKGVIISRYDTIKEIQAPSDWRNCVTRRWETAAPAWNAETTYAAGDIVRVASFNRVYVSSVGANNGHRPVYSSDAYWQVVLNLAQFTYWNASPTSWNGVPSAETYDDFQLFNTLSACGNTSIDTIIPTYDEDKEDWSPATLLLNSLFINVATSNTIGCGFISNTISYGFQSNTIGNNFIANTIGEDFNSNTIGNNFNSNTIDGYFGSNTIGNNFNSNTIGEGFSSNTIGEDFNSNTIGNQFGSNTIGNQFGSNTIGEYFGSNTIGNRFSSNTIGEYFIANTIGEYFGSNAIGNQFIANTIDEDFIANTIGEDFNSNTIGSGFDSTDYTSATHVYGAYDCTLFKRLDGTLKLRYFDNDDVQQVVAVTA